MDVAKVKEKKLELEVELSSLINKFEVESGVCVTGIDLPSVLRFVDSGGGTSYYRRGKLTVEVEVLN